MGENRGPQLIGVTCFFLAFSWIFVILRCYCRTLVMRSFGLDDVFCLLAQVFFSAFCAFSLVGVAYGAGQHMTDIQPQSHIPIGVQWWWACEHVYVLCSMMLKFSVGAFLLRICISKVHRAIVWSVIGVSGVTCVYYFFVFVFQCWPVAYFWGQYAGMQGICIDIVIPSSYAFSAISCWSNLTYCILPAFMVWNLQMSRRTKISVCVILGVSSIASAATIIRIPYIQGLKPSSDFLFTATDVFIWSMVETGLALSACASATLHPLFRKFTGRSPGGGTTRQGTTGGPQNNWASARVGCTRNGSGNDHGYKEEIGVRTDIGAGVIEGGDVIYLARWLEDFQAFNAEVDRVSNSSQTQLKADEENGISLARMPSGIRKTVVVSSRVSTHLPRS